MALASVEYTGNGVTQTFVVTFSYLEEDHVTVTLDDVVTTAYTWTDSTNIEFTVAPGSGVVINISRDSDITQKIVEYADGSNLTEEDLNNQSDQSLYLQQETRDLIDTINADNSSVLGRVIQNETDIATNVADIATNSANISSNDADIATNVSDIATNAADIAQNVTDIEAANSTDIFSARIDEVGGLVMGDVVYINGATGSKMEASKAISSDFTKTSAIAIAVESGSDNSTINFIHFGELGGLDTSSWSEGDNLYLSDTAGQLTNTYPTGIDAAIRIGVVVRSHATLGTIFVHIDSYTLVDNQDSIVRSQVVNTSTGTSAVTTSNLVNDAGHRGGISLTGSNYPTIPEQLTLFNEGYGDTAFIVDGNKDFSWLTDTTDSHNLSMTEKMKLSASGDLTISGTVDGRDVAADGAAQDAHIADVAGNPHAVTATEVGLGNVDNTSDVDKPVSSATQTEIDTKQDELITTRGDVIIGNASGVSERLGIGTAGQVLKSDGTDVAWGAGGGSGGINYLSDGSVDAEVDIGDWVTYTDAPVSENPIDGTGGGSSITLTQNSTTPLRGTNDFKLTKGALDTQGEGISVDFTIDSADKAKKLTISFDYDASHAGYSDGDVRLSVYDVTNSTLIRINGEDLKAGKGTHYAQFQTASDSTSYRLIAHVSSTNASAYDLYFDNFSVGPGVSSSGGRDVQTRVYRSSNQSITNSTETKIQLDSVSFDTTASFDNTTDYDYTVPESGYYDILAQVNIGNTTSSTVSANQRAFVTFKINGASESTLGTKRLSGGFTGTWNFDLSGSDKKYLNKGDVLTFFVEHNFGSNVKVGSTSDDNTFVAINKIGASTGSTSVGGGRDVVVRGAGNGGTSLTANVTNIDFTQTEDTTASWSGSVFTAPETGHYMFVGSVDHGSVATLALQAYVNGTVDTTVGYNEGTSTNSSFAGGAFLNKGDTLSIRSNTSTALVNSPAVHSIFLYKIASPQTALETETVAAKYSEATAFSIGSTESNIKYTDKSYDTHNAYDVSTGEYTVPVSGYYMINASVSKSSATSLSTAQNINIDVKKNSTELGRDILFGNGATNTAIVQVSTMDYLEKGDVITANVQTSVSANTQGEARYNSFTIAKIK